MKATEFVLEQQGKALQKNFDEKRAIVANMLKLNEVDKYRGQMMHITIAEWCEPFLAKMMGEEHYNIKDIVAIDDESSRKVVFEMMEQYWRVNNLKDSISFHKDDNSVVLQMMCYAQSVKPFGFSVYNELISGDKHQYKDWYKVLERMVEDAKKRVWSYITTSI